jgi:hypothetical protein
MQANLALKEKTILCRMEMLFSFVSMFRKWERSILFSFLFVFCFSHDTVILAQDANLELNHAFSILEERGELVFEFYPEDISVVREINTFLSVDRRTSKGFEAYANETGFRAFLEYGIPFSIVQRESAKKSLSFTGDFPGNWDVYPSYYQYTDFMMNMALEYPNICRLDTIGQSIGGKEILAVKITDNPGIREPEPAFVYSSTMHGDETTGYVTLLHLVEYLCKNYGSDSLVTKLVDGIEIWINPLANPDGTYFTGTDSIFQPKRFNLNDIDLNRDFPSILEPYDYIISEEPETKEQIEFLESVYLVMGANFHDGEEVVNYPFDTWQDLHADDEWYMETSTEYAATAQQRSGVVNYMESVRFPEGITNGWEWYFTDGSRQDWINYHYHAREVTIEINLTKHPPASELPYYWFYNYPSMLRYMEQSLFGIQGMIKDEDTGEPLQATIRIQGHDKLGSQILSDGSTGYFARLIKPGTWNLEISADGYEDLQISDVESVRDKARWLDIELRSLDSDIRNRQSQKISGIAFLTGSELNLPVNNAGVHGIYIYDLKGMLVHQYYKNYPSAGRYMYSLEGIGLLSGVYILKIITPVDIQSYKIFKSQ